MSKNGTVTRKKGAKSSKDCGKGYEDLPQIFWSSLDAVWGSRLRDKPALTFVEWGNRYLSNPDGSRFTFRPYQVQPALDLFDERLQYVAVRWFSGAGKTYLFAAALCYGAHQLGLHMATMMPAELQAKEWLRDEFEPILAATGVMQRMVYRKRGDQALAKRWHNGSQLRVLGSNSSGELRRLQVDLMMADEVDAYKSESGDEGDRLAQFWKRGRGRQRQFHWAASYPSLRGDSRIDTLLEASDYGQWMVECIHCSGAYVMHTDQIRMADKNPLTAVLECPMCARTINDAQRREMSAAGRFIDRHGNPMTSKLPKEHGGRRGYFVGCMAHIGDHSAAYPSYLVEVASEMQRIDKSDNKERSRRVFVNTMDAESYQPPHAVKVSASELLERREPYNPREALPEGVLLLTAGGDVQGDRVEFEVVGHGDDGQTWGCGYYVIHGFTDRPSTWAKVESWLRNTRWRHPHYGDMRPTLTLLDSRYRQREVLRFTAGKGTRYGISPCYGSPSPSKPAVSQPKRAGKPPQPIYEIGTNEIKDHIYQALFSRPGQTNYMHYPVLDEYDERYFAQLQAEEREWIDGVTVFKNPNQLRNEALDVRVYAVAAKMILMPSSNFAKLRANLDARAERQPKSEAGLSLPIPKPPRKRWI